jgi:hypothetical protein
MAPGGLRPGTARKHPGRRAQLLQGAARVVRGRAAGAAGRIGTEYLAQPYR